MVRWLTWNCGVYVDRRARSTSIHGDGTAHGFLLKHAEYDYANVAPG